MVVVAVLRTSAVSLPPLTGRNLGLLGGLILINFASLVLRGIVNTESFQLGRSLRGYWDGFCLGVWHSSANFLPLSPGLAAKGVMLHQMYGVGARQYVAISLLVFIAAIAANGVSGLVGLAMVESTAIYCFVISMILIFANPFWDHFLSQIGG